MKTTALALAGLVALSGAAFAGETVNSHQAPATCVETATKAKLDCAATGSIETTHPATGQDTAETRGPRLGIGINPWIMPTTF